MKQSFTTINLTLQTLTPVHIGSGTSLMKGADFFYDQNNQLVGRVNPKKLYPKYINDIDEWSNAIMKGEDIYRKYLSARNVPLTEICDEIIPVASIQGKELKEFIRNSLTRNPIIPGSSLKGAIRTALLTNAIVESDEFKNEFNQLLEAFQDDVIKIKNSHHLEIIKKRDLRKTFRNFVNKVENLFHNQFDKVKIKDKYTPQNDIFKYLQVSDAEGNISDLKVDTFQTLNIDGNEKWYIKQKLTQTAEVFEGQTAFTIHINDEFWKKNKYGIKNADDFLNKINQHTKRLVNREIQVFKEDVQYDYFTVPDVGNKLIDNNQHLIKQSTEGDVLLRISAGSGWDFMTGSWLKEITNDEQWEMLKEFLVKKDYYTEFPYPKTRRLLSDYRLPGFVKLKKKL